MEWIHKSLGTALDKLNKNDIAGVEKILKQHKKNVYNLFKELRGKLLWYSRHIDQGLEATQSKNTGILNISITSMIDIAKEIDRLLKVMEKKVK